VTCAVVPCPSPAHGCHFASHRSTHRLAPDLIKWSRMSNLEPLWETETFRRVHRAVEDLDPIELEAALRDNPNLDINADGYMGWRLLFTAIESEFLHQQDTGRPGSPNLIVSQVLLRHGADPAVAHPDGWNAIDFARKYHHNEFLRLIGESPVDDD